MHHVQHDGELQCVMGQHLDRAEARGSHSEWMASPPTTVRDGQTHASCISRDLIPKIQDLACGHMKSWLQMG